LESAESQKNDRRLARIDQLDDLVGMECMSMNFSQQALRYVDERVRLYNQQGPGHYGLPRAYLDAAQIVIANSDLVRGSVFARRAVEGWRTAHGSDSDEVIEYSPLIQDPAKLPLYGISMRWKTSVEDALSQSDSKDFEDWLWRREMPKQLTLSGQLTSFRNREVFPNFANLPLTSRIEPGAVESFEDPYQTPHHWCLLGEIVSSITLHHLEFELEDIDQKRFPLHFNTDDRGNELEITNIQEGHTVAVLYAKRRAFVYGDPGVDHVDSRMLKVRKYHPRLRCFSRITDNLNATKIFSVPLNRVLELSDRVQQFSVAEKGIKTCNGCGNKAALSQRCGRCSLFWYCDSVRMQRNSLVL
jgi:hypothetical protein